MMMSCGTGWLSWADFHQAIPDWQAVWVDLTGPHTAGLPSRAPQSTHLWAWDDDRWCRARVDGDEVVAGFLHPDARCPLGGSDCAPATTTEVSLAQSWAEEHIDVGTLRGMHWELIEVVDGVAATFVRPAGGVSR